MTSPDCAAEKALVSLDEPQRLALAELLKRERKQMSRWWTHLNELRCRGELPEWAYKNEVGTGVDHDEWLDACAETNEALFGKKVNVRFAYETRPSEAFVNADLTPMRILEATHAGKCSERVKQPGTVRQHRPGISTLVSTKLRAGS